MRSKIWIIFSLLVILIIGLFPQSTSQAAPGIPGSTEFGFGALLNINGLYLEQALPTAYEMHLDWLNIELDWAALYPALNSVPDWSKFDKILTNINTNEISILISLTNPPAWARTSSGPDVNQTIQLISLVLKRYPQVKAIELFPGANTLKGWGSSPDPKAYLQLFNSIRSQLKTKINLVAAGLIPIPSTLKGNDIDDLVYLDSLYKAGGKDTLNIISLQLFDLTGEPNQPPDIKEHRVLRHYEEIRQVMLANNHASGLLWITKFCPPTGKISSKDVKFQEPLTQSTWMSSAYTQLRSQMYLGVAMLMSLNPMDQVEKLSGMSIIQNETTVHPFLKTYGVFVAQNNPLSMNIPGRAKANSIVKQKK